MTVLPRALFRTQPKVYGRDFCKISRNNFLLLTFIEKKIPAKMFEDVPKTVLLGVKKKEMFFFNCYLAAPWPTLGYSQRDSLTNLMLITGF